MTNRAVVRRLIAPLVAIAAAGCASAPSGPDASPFSSAMSVCRGLTVSNAPPNDGQGRIDGFSPVVDVRHRRLLTAPTAGCLSSGFGRRDGRRGIHEGVDISTYGQPRPVLAGGDGEVTFAGRYGEYGLTVMIDHGRGVSTRYAHLSRIASDLRPGARVQAGAPIGQTGRTGKATGVHLHYEIRVDGRPVDPFGVR